MHLYFVQLDRKTVAFLGSNFVCYLAIVKCVVSHAASVGASLTYGLSILCRVQIRFFLKFADVLLVSNSLVAEPIRNLRFLYYRILGFFHTWLTVIPHFLASSSFASSDG